jgi:putative colanic acid biosynthesis acetyltransferase WcaF
MNKTDLSSFKNEDYYPGAAWPKRSAWYIVNILFFINPMNPFYTIKTILLRAFGAKVGSGLIIKPSVNIKYPWNLTIGDHVWIGEKVWIDNLGKVTLENNVCISQGAMLLCGNHNYKKSTFDLNIQNIVIKEGAWIGATAIIGPGVVVQSHAVLTVGSVTSANLEAYTIYRGNPAEQVGERIIS